MKFKIGYLVKACLLVVAAGSAMASSHREAPFITTSPKVDGTDFYMFRSYDGIDANGAGGRSNYVTLLANYQPLQAPYGGPNYFQMDPNALYEIHIDNVGDAKEHMTFQFRFTNALKSIALPIGSAGAKTNVAIPLIQAGAVSTLTDAKLNVNESYTLKLVRGDRRKGDTFPISKISGASTFEKPVDNIGTKTIADYAAYASQHIHSINIPGCSDATKEAKVFVGQRAEGFAVNLGAVFDLVNAKASDLIDPAQKDAAGMGGMHAVQKTNVTTIALEIHKDCLTAGGEPVIGGWTTASLRQVRLLNPAPKPGNTNAEKAGGAWVQVSRLGNPLVNELVIGLPDKDKFNASAPKDDLQFLTYVSKPTLPALLTAVLGADVEPTNFPRTDLLTTFLTGITNVNKPANPTPSEMMRLNTAVLPVPVGMHNRLGVAGNALAGGTDKAGYPNGRRPKDDVVDISLVAMVGGLCFINGNTNKLLLNSVPGQTSLTSTCNESSPSEFMRAKDNSGVPNAAKIHDAVDQATVPFLSTFPYLNTPNPGAM